MSLFLNAAMTVAASATFICYVMYSIDEHVVAVVGRLCYLTSFFVLGGIFAIRQACACVRVWRQSCEDDNLRQGDHRMCGLLDSGFGIFDLWINDLLCSIWTER